MTCLYPHGTPSVSPSVSRLLLEHTRRSDPSVFASSNSQVTGEEKKEKKRRRMQPHCHRDPSCLIHEAFKKRSRSASRGSLGFPSARGGARQTVSGFHAGRKGRKEESYHVKLFRAPHLSVISVFFWQCLFRAGVLKGGRGKCDQMCESNPRFLYSDDRQLRTWRVRSKHT